MVERGTSDIFSPFYKGVSHAVSTLMTSSKSNYHPKISLHITTEVRASTHELLGDKKNKSVQNTDAMLRGKKTATTPVESSLASSQKVI